MDDIKIYAHRGASGYELENTWNAFFKACEIGAGIELDVQITKNGVVLIHHDDDLKRLSGKDIEIAEADYEEIKDLQVKRRGVRRTGSHKIPLAYEVFQWAKKKSIPLNVELKGSFSVHPEGPKILAAMLEGMEDVHVSSTDTALLKEMKKLMPSTETALIVKRRFPLERVRKMDWIDSVHFHKRLYSAKRLEQLARLGKKFRIYGIRGTEKLVQGFDSNLVGIITDYPDRVKEKLGQPV